MGLQNSLEMQSALKLLEKWQEEGEKCHHVHDMQNRIGIHTGPMVTGKWVTQRMNYTMMGDTVNLPLDWKVLVSSMVYILIYQKIHTIL